MTSKRIRSMLTLISLLAGIFFFSEINAQAAPGPTKISAEVSFGANRVLTIKGSLIDQNSKPVQSAQIQVLIAGNVSYSMFTDGAGAFNAILSLTSDVPGGTELAIKFPGNGNFQSSTAYFSFPAKNAAPNAPGNAVITVSTDKPKDPASGNTVATAGTQVVLSGSVTENGKPVNNGVIRLFGPKGEIKEGQQKTDSTGKYETYYLIPEDQPSGNIKLTLKYFRNDGSQAALVVVPVRVEAEISSQTPSSSAAKPSPSPTVVPSVSALPSAAAKASSSAAAVAPKNHAKGQSLTLIVAAAVLVVSGAVVILITCLIFRNRRREKCRMVQNPTEPSEGILDDFIHDDD